ncbi:MAG: putative metal-binding motif-containing protein [Deltaproteobacteria bacterium]|nr:putative metal-binding motif-containing protein [Deltaproteobacteria bacterium]
MGSSARQAGIAWGAFLAVLPAALAGCGLDSAGLREQDAAGPGTDLFADADGAVDADADAEVPLEATEASGDPGDGEADGAATDDTAIGDAGPDDAADGDGAADEVTPGCVAGATRPCAVEPGECGPGEQACVAGGVWGECVDLGPPAAPEVCDRLDNDCDGVTDDLGETTCGDGACEVTVPNCVDGVPQTCVAGSPTTCGAPPAYCHETTTGTDDCGNPCTKVGPDHCHTVHPACLDSSPGAPTDTASCDTPRGRYNCGLTCEEWPNTIGADCVYCVNTFCASRSGLDEAQFRCNNIPVPPTP